MRMLPEGIVQFLFELVTHRRNSLDKTSVEFLEYRQGCRTGCRMTDIGMTVLKEAGPVFDRPVNFIGAQHGTDGLVSGAEPLGNTQNVWRNAVLLVSEQRSGTAHAAHHLVEDQQDTIGVADFPNALEISLNGRHRSCCGTDDRFGDKGHHVFRSQPKDFRLQFAGDPLAIFKSSFSFPATAIFETWSDMGRFDHQRRKWLTSPLIAACCQRAKRIAVIALTPRNYPVTGWFALFKKVLTGELERRFNGFGPSRNEIDTVKVSRSPCHEQIRELFRRFRREKSGMCKGDPVHLILDCLCNVRIGMPKAGDSGTT